MANQEINIVIKAIDKFSKNFNGINKSLGNLSKKAKENAGTFKKATAISGIGIAGITYQIKSLTDAYKIQESAEKQVAQTIISTGGTAGKTLDELKKKASDFQKTSIYGDEDILQGASSQLLTFGNITGDVFDKVQQAALDVDSKLNGVNASGSSLRSTSILLGKAFNDPIANLGALGRSGIQFDETQKELIKTMWKNGEQAKAQALILEELNKYYGGSAKATADALGPTHQLSKSWGDMKEKLGGALIPAINELALSLTPLIQKFSNFVNENPKLFKNIVMVTGGILGLVAVFGTLGLIIPTVIKGFSSIILIVKGLGTALTFLSANPIGLVITAIAGLVFAGYQIIKNWDKVKAAALSLGEKLSEIWSSIQSYITTIVDNITTSTKEKFQSLVDFVVSIFEKITGIYNKAKNLANKAKDKFSGFVGNIKSKISGERANGGNVQKGKTYVVGERGPELFTPYSSGDITPNHNLGSQTININVSGNNIGNEADENRLAEKIKKQLSHELKMYKFGIS